MPVLLLEEEYEERQRACLAKVRRLGLRVNWVAEQIGRVRQWTSQVLNGSRYSQQTLAAIEMLLEDVQCGRVEVER